MRATDRKGSSYRGDADLAKIASETKVPLDL